MRELQGRLEAQGTAFRTQKTRIPHVTNIVVDFSSSPLRKHLLFSAHYDSVAGSPGANDNASSVAVLLGLCRVLKDSRTPVRVVFFDREESWFRTPFLRLGLLGSFSYAFRNNLSKVQVMYNLEFCGLGESLAIWPVKPSKKALPAVRIAQAAASSLNVESRVAHVPWVLLSSDHLPFRLAGLSNCVTLSLLPGAELPVLESFTRDLSIRSLLTGRRPVMPGVLGRIHKTSDDSSGLSEASLQLMLSLLLHIIETYPISGAQS